MIRTIYKERKWPENVWERNFLEAATEGVDLGTIEFATPEESLRRGEVKLFPIDTKLYLLDYLKVTHPMGEQLTVQHVINSIPKEISHKVCAVEFVIGFYDVWTSTIFIEDIDKHQLVTFVALLTEENTGKDLPPTMLTAGMRPINISDDDWRRVVREGKLK